jgi:hypothetical protein
VTWLQLDYKEFKWFALIAILLGSPIGSTVFLLVFPIGLFPIIALFSYPLGLTTAIPLLICMFMERRLFERNHFFSMVALALVISLSVTFLVFPYPSDFNNSGTFLLWLLIPIAAITSGSVIWLIVKQINTTSINLFKSDKAVKEQLFLQEARNKVFLIICLIFAPVPLIAGLVSKISNPDLFYLLTSGVFWIINIAIGLLVAFFFLVLSIIFKNMKFYVWILAGASGLIFTLLFRFLLFGEGVTLTSNYNLVLFIAFALASKLVTTVLRSI